MIARLGQIGNTAVQYLIAVFKQAVDVGGRQFFLCWSLFVASLVMRAFDLLSEGGFMTLMLASVVAYITGNQVQSHIEAKAANAEAAK
jgi:hypothetical protein